MSENKPSKREVRLLGAHPEKQIQKPTGLDGINPAVPIKGRKPLMTGPGLFDSEAQKEFTILTIDENRLALEPRRLRFMPGTKLYYLTKDSEGKPIIPRTELEEDRLFDRQLQVETDLDVPVEYLVSGKRGGTITKKVGQSQYGAFTVVMLPVNQENGEVRLEERLVSYQTRSRKGKL